MGHRPIAPTGASHAEPLHQALITRNSGSHRARSSQDRSSIQGDTDPPAGGAMPTSFGEGDRDLHHGATLYIKRIASTTMLPTCLVRSASEDHPRGAQVMAAVETRLHSPAEQATPVSIDKLKEHKEPKNRTHAEPRNIIAARSPPSTHGAIALNVFGSPPLHIEEPQFH